MLRNWFAAMSRRSPVDFAMLTDVGRARQHNEDACAADEAAGLFVVCDGMGGAAGGEIASHMAARVFLEQGRAGRGNTPAEDRLQKAVQQANRAVFQESQRDIKLRGMGTTLVGIEMDTANERAWLANVGDSRCYRLREGVLEQLSEDHSYVDEQVRMGLMTPDQAAISNLRNIITRAVGSHPDVIADVTEHEAKPGDVFLLCSDGLTRELDDEEISGVMQEGVDHLQACAGALVHLANEYGGSDNLTVVLIRV